MVLFDRRRREGRIRTIAAVIALAATYGACHRTRPAAPEPAAVVDTLPTPFTADQIRDAMPAGAGLTMVLTEGGATSTQEWTVLAADDTAMMLRVVTTDAEGAVTEETSTAPWTALRDHASFPVGAATRRRATTNSDLGMLEGWQYEVTVDGHVSTYFFADAHPGPPIFFNTRLPDGRMLLARITAVR